MQLIWTNITNFFLDDNCGSWSDRSNPALEVYYNAGATLVNTVQLFLDSGRKTVSLPILNRTNQAVGEYYTHFLCVGIGLRAAYQQIA